MPPEILTQPDNGTSPTGTSTVPAGQGRLQGALDAVNHWVGTIPGWLWVIALTVLLALVVVALPIARTQARKAGARINGKVGAVDKKDRRLLVAVLAPAVLFWLAVLIGSGRSLVGFGRDDLGWTGGWELLVPFTLDGVAVAFGALAFRAIAKERNPDRAYRVVWMATAASAAINFFHEVGGSTLGAGYLAILSLFGMLIFHELLAQFEEGAAWIKRTNPKFGLRWLTWPTNTLCAWIAWRNYPPAEGTAASIAVAVEHLETVRRTKTERRATEVDAPVWWMRLAPWTEAAALRTALTEQRSATSAEHTSNTILRTDLNRMEHLHRTAVADMTERQRISTEQVRSEAAEHLDRLRTEHSSEVAQLRAELAGKVLRIERPTVSSSRPTSTKTPERKSAPGRTTDAEALADMFTEHPEPGYDWTDREVNRITGAGFSSRAPRLTGMAVKHLANCAERSHDTCYSERSDSRSDDSKEQAS